MRYGQHRFFEQKPLYVISLREPVDRYASFYRFVQKNEKHVAHEGIANCNIEEAFEIHFEANKGNAVNGQCRYISGDGRLRDQSAKKVIQALKSNYYLPMPMNNIEQSVSALREAFDLRKIRVQQLNVGHGPKVDISPALRSKIEAANEMDAEVYTWVCENYKELLENACEYAHSTCRSY